MPIDINRPAGLDEDDPLWQYYLARRRSDASDAEGDYKYNRDISDIFAKQRLNQDLLSGISQAGALMGTVGGRIPKEASYEPRYDAEAKFRMGENLDEARKMKRDTLYQDLMKSMSSKIAAKDRAAADIERAKMQAEFQRKKYEDQKAAQEARAAQAEADRAAKAAQAQADRDAKAAQAEAEREFKKAQAEADRAAKAAETDKSLKAKRELEEKKLQLQKALLEKRAVQSAGVPKPEKQERPNEGQSAYASFGASMMEAEKKMQEAKSQGYDPTTVESGARGLPIIKSFAQTQPGRSFDAAKRLWILSYLRKTSGAAIGAEEYDNVDKTYFPQVGDGPDVISQKAQARKQEADKFTKLGGSATKLIKPSGAPQGSSDVDKARKILEVFKKKPALLNSTDPKDIKMKEIVIKNGLGSELEKIRP